MPDMKELTKLTVIQCNETGDLCQRMGSILTQISPHALSDFSQDEMMMMSGDLVTMRTCLMRCEELFNKRV